MKNLEIVKVYPKQNGILYILFSDGLFKKMDISILFDDYPEFKELLNETLFKKCKLLANYIIKWNDNLDLVMDTVYEMSELCDEIESPTIPMLGYHLKKIRMEKGLSQKQLSALTQIDQADISKIENGLCNPSLEYIEKITNALGRKLSIKI